MGDSLIDIYKRREFTRWVLFMTFTMLVSVIMVNLLIAIVGDAYDRVKYNQKASDMRSKTTMLLNLGQFLSFLKKTLLCKKVEEGKLMYVHRFVYANQEEMEQTEKWDGRVRVLSNKQDKVIRLVSDFKREFEAKLSTNSVEKKMEEQFAKVNKLMEEQVGKIDLKVKDHVAKLDKRIEQ